MEIEVMESKVNPKSKTIEWFPRKTFCNISPICFFLTNETKERFKDEMNIENLTSKHISIMSAKDEFLIEMQGNREFFERWPRTYQYFTVNNLDVL